MYKVQVTSSVTIAPEELGKALVQHLKIEGGGVSSSIDDYYLKNGRLYRDFNDPQMDDELLSNDFEDIILYLAALSILRPAQFTIYKAVYSDDVWEAINRQKEGVSA